MGILKNHLRKESSDIRWEQGDLILYNPTESQIEEVYTIISDKTRIEDNEILGEYGENIIMYFIKELSNIGEEVNDYTYEELVTKYDIDNLINAIASLIEDITNEVMESHLNDIKMINRMLKIFELNLSSEETQVRFNKLLKKQGINLTVDQMVEYKDNPEKIQELIKKPKIKSENKRNK